MKDHATDLSEAQGADFAYPEFLTIYAETLTRSPRCKCHFG